MNARRIIATFFGLLALCISTTALAGTIYVKHDATGANDGSSWADAFTDLQPGIDAAQSGDEVWVAAGTYKPTSWPNGGSTEREKHFSLKNGVTVYGGFSGIEIALDQRDIAANRTICTGDFDNDDVVSGSGETLSVSGNTENAYHVFYHPNTVTLSLLAILDGMTIEGGRADGGNNDNYGGGMCNESSSCPILRYCVFTGNYASYGGSIYNSFASNPVILKCMFGKNIAVTRGGGIYNSSSDPTVTNCIFSGNKTFDEGGGICGWNSQPTITNCTFTGNCAVYGGGMYNTSKAPIVTNSIFWENASLIGNPEIYGYTSGTSYCVVQGGLTGGTNIIVGDPLLQPLYDNGEAVPIFILGRGSSAIDAGILSGAPATDARGISRPQGPGIDVGAYEYSGSEASWLIGTPDSIAFGDTALAFTENIKEINISASMLTEDVSMTAPSCFELSLDGSTWGRSLVLSPTNGIVNQTVQVRFIPAEVAAYSDSLSIVSGSLSSVIAVSGAGGNMIVYHVSPTGNNSDGLTWAKAFNDPQRAIDLAASQSGIGHQVWIRAATYLPTSWPNGGTRSNERHFSLRNGVSVYGGFSGTETALVERDISLNLTTLSGDFNGDDSVNGSGRTFMLGGNFENARHVFYHPIGTNLNSTAILDGVILTGGNSDSYPHYYGGGMYNDCSNPALINCVFKENRATNYGGGMCNFFSSPILSDCTFSRNIAENGAGMYNDSSSPSVVDCIFAHNTAFSGYGGGMYSRRLSSPIVVGCKFEANSVSHYGGGMYNRTSCARTVNCIFVSNRAYGGGGIYNVTSKGELTNCTLVRNSASIGGGGVYNYASSPWVMNCTFTENESSWYGAGMLNNHSEPDREPSNPVITNCIFWANRASSDPEICNTDSVNAPNVAHCVIQGGYSAGIGIVDQNPHLQPLNNNGGGMHTVALSSNSSAVDAGTAASAPFTDARGVTRPNGGGVDIGAYERDSTETAWLSGAPKQLEFGGTAIGSLQNRKSIRISGSLLSSGAMVTASTGFDLSLNGSTWSSSLSLPLTDGIVNQKIQVRFNPTATATFSGSISIVSDALADTIDISGEGLPMKVYYVSKTGNGSNGLSWISAFNDPQLAIDQATAQSGTGHQVWIATGLYTPKSWPNGGSSSMERHFALKNGVSVFGGFSGTEITLAQRDIAVNPVILSGDFAGNDIVDGSGETLSFVGNSENAEHVFYHQQADALDATAVLDGVSVSGGNALYQHAGGMYNSFSSPTILNCTFTGNNGGTYGGGIYNEEFSDPIITNCVFTQNRANIGGGIYNKFSNPTIANCTFSGNNGRGAGIYSSSYSCPKISNSAFRNNSTNSDGGGVAGYFGTILNCSFTGNNASDGGGAHGAGALINCTFSDNTASEGSGYYDRGSNPGYYSILVNCTFNANSASQYGGGMYIYNSNPVIANCTFSGNSADFYGGGIYCSYSSKPVIRNSIIWNNTATRGGPEIHSGQPLISYCIIQGGYADGTNIISLDPLLEPLQDNGSSVLTVAIAQGSPAIDTGVTIGCPATDARGIHRPQGGGVDIGAYEYDDEDWYTLVFSNTEGGGLIGATQQAIWNGQNSSPVEAVPDTGYHFVNWTKATIHYSANNPLSITNVSENITLTARFEINTYTLTYAAGVNGSVAGASPQTVDYGTDGSAVIAVPTTGCHFVKWSDGVTTAMRTDTGITADLNVIATFAINTYAVTFDVDANGTLTGSYPQDIDHGGDCTEIYAAPDTGYHFVKWTKGGVDYSTDNPLTILNVTENMTMTAHFAINSYTLTYKTGANGTLTGARVQNIEFGSDGTAITAVPDPNYHFIEWSDGLTTATRTDTGITADLNVTASFAINNYTLTYNAGTNGKLTGTTSQAVDHGSDGSAVTAVPTLGYHFVEWSDGVTTATRTDTGITTDLNVTATFAINTYTLTYTAGSNGTITGNASQSVDHGSDGSQVTAVPDSSYHFVQWSDGVMTATRTDTGIAGDLTVAASFAIDTYSLTYSAGSNGSISGAASQAVDHGADGSQVTAVPDAGYHFVEWSDSVTTETRTDTAIIADLNVTATFAINTYTLVYNAGSNGSLTGTAAQAVDHGSDGTTVTAVPEAGYHFVEWSDGITTVTRTDTTITADLNVTATFAANSSGGGGGGGGCALNKNGNSTMSLALLALLSFIMAIISRFHKGSSKA